MLAFLLSLAGCEFALPKISIPQLNEGGTLGGNNTPGDNNTSGNTPGEGTEGKNEACPEGSCDMQEKMRVDSTCEAAGMVLYECSVCHKSESEPLPLASHTEVTVPGCEPEGNTPGLTVGVVCDVCGAVLVAQEYVYSDRFTTPDSYDGRYAYDSLMQLGAAEGYAELYSRIDAAADAFHSSATDITADDRGVCAEIEFSDLGLTAAEALAVWSAYRADRPLYYWISNEVSHTQSRLFLTVYEEYWQASVRGEKNSLTYNAAKEMISSLSGTSVYHRALALHDMIITAADYAYLDDGVTPTLDPSAHGILGIFDTGEAVCEAYAKAFQLLLNYLGVENVLVAGYAGEAHAWNLVKLDDGEWYWCDLTWDDTPGFFLGISHKYFMITDSTDLSGADGPWVCSDTTFLASHQPYAPQNEGANYNYSLPARSESEFSAQDALVREVFTVGDYTYAISGYGTVQLVGAANIQSIVIPESVEYLGTVYAVRSVGIITDGWFETGSITFDYTEKNTVFVTETVYIPKSVLFVWDDAFDFDSLLSFEVDRESATFESNGGALFTKGLETLIKYPAGRAEKSYTLPDETKYIAAGAFSKFYYNRTLELEKIILGEGFVSMGIANYGYGYTFTSQSPAVNDELDNIIHYLGGAKEIVDKMGAPYDA